MAALSARGWLLALAAALALGGCERASNTPAEGKFKAVDITGAPYAQGFDLPDTEGARRTLADFKGKVTVVFFGFTQCPDVCPTTMVEMAQVKQALGPDGDRVQGIFVTVDPERDTPEVLRAYVRNFAPDFVALRGTPEETLSTAKSFKVFYAKVPGSAEGSYSVDHTAGSYIFDGQGRIRLFTRYGAGVEALQHDVRLLLDESPA